MPALANGFKTKELVKLLCRDIAGAHFQRGFPHTAPDCSFERFDHETLSYPFVAVFGMDCDRGNVRFVQDYPYYDHAQDG